MHMCLSYNAFDNWPQSSLLSCIGKIKFKICELRITRYPNLEFFKFSTIIMQGNWAFRLPCLLNMGRQVYSDRFKCVCVPLMTSELINNFNVFTISSKLFYVTLLTALLLNMLADSLVQVLTQLMLDTSKFGSVNVSTELLLGVDVLVCCGLGVEFTLILRNWDTCIY